VAVFHIRLELLTLPHPAPLVDCIRAQRAFSIQMPDQYVFCHLAFLEYVLNMGYVEEIDLTGFDEDVPE